MPRSGDAGAARLLGGCGGQGAWNQTGRPLVPVVLALDPGGREADVILGAGRPAPLSFTQGTAPGWSRHRAQHQFGRLVWTDEAGDRYEVSPLLTGGGVELLHTKTITAAWRPNAQARAHLPRIE